MSERRFKVGDRVRVIDGLKVGMRDDGFLIFPPMADMSGCVYEITDLFGKDGYVINEYAFPDCYIECKVKEVRDEA